MDLDPKRFPYVRWRVDQVFGRAHETAKQGDDYPARLYIAFRYERSRVGLVTRAKFALARKASRTGEYPPLYALNYVWVNHLEPDT